MANSAHRERIEIVLADDHAMVRRGLRMVLEAEEGLVVVAEAADVGVALHRAREHQPAVVVLDLNMPGSPTLPALARFLALAPRSAVVVLTMEADPAMARTALAAGAKAYVLKEGAESALVDAVRAAASGRTYLDPGLGAQLAAAPPGPDAPLHIGSRFAGHRIDAVAGEGGMGVVYRATDVALERPVAVKLIAPAQARDPVFRTRFERECRLAAALDHPNVVTVFRAGEEDGRLYVTMRLIDGTDLRALRRAEGALDPRRAVRVIEQIAGALDEAHAHGLVHRDVKPANILIGARSGEERAFLTDFGVSKHRTAGAELTGTGLAIGTPDYMAPSRRGADRSTRGPMSTRWAVCCSKPSPASSRSTTRAISTTSGPMCTSRSPIWARCGRICRARWSLSCRPRWPQDPSERPASAGALAREARAALNV